MYYQFQLSFFFFPPISFAEQKKELSKKTRGRSVKGEGEECIQEIIVLGRRAGFSEMPG